MLQEFKLAFQTLFIIFTGLYLALAVGMFGQGLVESGKLRQVQKVGCYGKYKRITYFFPSYSVGCYFGETVDE